MKPKIVIQNFIWAINSQDVETIVELMTPDHKFIDGGGQIISGREPMRQGWIGYFQLVPDYQIFVSEMFESGDTVAVFGNAGGTYSPDGKALKPENYWETPAAWRAVVENDKVKEWQVFADNEPTRRLMERHQI